VNTCNSTCFACKTKGWLYDFLKRRFGLTYDQAKAMCRGYWQDGPSGSVRTSQTHTNALSLPQGATKDFTRPFLDYLANRNFGPEVINRYDLYSGSYFGPFRYRLVIPIYKDSILVNYLGRDITGIYKARYRNCPNSLAVIPSKSCVYNLDMAMDKVIICEGPTDVWRMGMSAICTLGTTFTNDQVMAIKKAGVTHAAVFFDPGEKSQRLGIELSKVLNSVGVQAFNCDIGGDIDPGDLDENTASLIRKEIWAAWT